MSEKDIGLKLAARRLAWNQGFATRLSVPLRSYVERRPGRPGHEEYTDLDVIVFGTSPSGVVQSQIFDCKSSSNRTTERTFWLRGVADFFGAAEAWMLRENEVTEASRQLAGRLQLGVLTKKNLDTLSEIAASSANAAPITPAVDRLFDVAAEEKVRAVRTKVDRRLTDLAEYIGYDYWVYRPDQNLSQMIAHLRSAARVLDGRSPIHLALLFDCLWLYSLSLAHAAEYVRRTNASNPYSALLEYFLGGQVAIREKEVRVKELQRLSPGAELSIEPDYFPQLAETFVRMYVHPGLFTSAMRYCEVATVNLADGRRPYLSNALGHEYSDVYGKLVYDLGAFLVSSARLSPSFRQAIRETTLGRNERADTKPGSESRQTSGQLTLDEQEQNK